MTRRVSGRTARLYDEHAEHSRPALVAKDRALRAMEARARRAEAALNTIELLVSDRGAFSTGDECLEQISAVVGVERRSVGEETGVPVLTAEAWATNGHLMADVARLGYLNGRVLDATWGMGVFWRECAPAELVGMDLDPTKAPHVRADFRALPFAAGSFDVVVFDPPYKLNGRPTEAADGRYGVHVPASPAGRMGLIFDGLADCLRVARHHVLVKCQDEVVSGHKVWQTQEIPRWAEQHGWKLVDRFDRLGRPRDQPHRRQVHTRQNYSTLLVLGR